MTRKDIRDEIRALDRKIRLAQTPELRSELSATRAFFIDHPGIFPAESKDDTHGD